MFNKIAVIVSTKDVAALNIKNFLLKLGFQISQEEFDNHKIYSYNNSKLYTTNTDSIYCENIDQKIDADFIIFATKHSSKSNIHSLSVHTQGNWGKSLFGGQDNNLGIAPASYLKKAFLTLKELSKNSGFEVIQEVTHHGPVINVPCMFIEIGSDDSQWTNKDAGLIIAKTIIHLIDFGSINCNSAFGIGGLHHSPILSKLTERTDICFGHICPKYNLEFLDEEMIRQAIEKTYNGNKLIILDWKGMGNEKDRIVKILGSMKLEYFQAEKMLKEIKKQI